MPFTTGRAELSAASVAPDRTVLRLTLPIDLARAQLRFDSAVLDAGPWRREPNSDSLFEYATGICEAWEARPATLFGLRSQVVLEVLEGPSAGLRLTLVSVRVFAFKATQLGFLVLTVTPQGPMPLVDWLDLAAGLRFSGGQRALKFAMIRRSGDTETRVWSNETGAGPIGDLVKTVCEGVLSSTDPRQTAIAVEPSPFLREQFLVAGAWFIAGVPSGREDFVRYLIRNQLNSRQSAGISEEGATRRQGGFVPYAHRQHFLSTLEGTHFVALDVPDEPFFASTLPSHLDREYFLAWVFALQQRFFLIRQVADLAGDALEEQARTATERFKLVEDHAAELARFEARGYEIHLLQREHHHRYWQSVRAALDIDQLHHNVVGLIERAMERARAQRTEEEVAERVRAEQRERDLELRIVLALAVPGVLLGFAGINISGWTAGGDGSPWWVATAFLVASLALIATLLWLGRRTRTSS